MKKLATGTVALVFAAALFAFASHGPSANANGSVVGVSPDVGVLGTPVELRSTDWLESTEVDVYAAFATSRDKRPPPEAYTGPVATAMADSEGDWQLNIIVDERLGVSIPPEPGFLFFRAESDDLPLYLADANVGDFAIVHDGRRPKGAGEIRLTISLAPGNDSNGLIIFVGRRPAGEGPIRNRAPGRPFPFNTTFGRLSDGVWEVAAFGTGGLVPVGGDGPLEVVEAPVCDYSECPEPMVINSYIVRKVTIRNGSVVDVVILLGEPGSGGGAQLMPSTGTGLAERNWNGWPTANSIVPIAVLGLVGLACLAVAAINHINRAKRQLSTKTTASK